MKVKKIKSLQIRQKDPACVSCKSIHVNRSLHKISNLYSCARKKEANFNGHKDLLQSRAQWGQWNFLPQRQMWMRWWESQWWEQRKLCEWSWAFNKLCIRWFPRSVSGAVPGSWGAMLGFDLRHLQVIRIITLLRLLEVPSAIQD